MEDRKRAAPTDPDDSLPPAKRQATAVNGAKPAMDGDPADLENIQKDAILRQMREYKREKATLEAQVVELEKRSTYHDDHLRIIDSWFLQLVDEIRIIANDILSLGQSQSSDAVSLPSSLFFADARNFQEHLAARSEQIKSALSSLFARVSVASPDVIQLQQQVAKLLAAEKSHIVELQRVTAEKEQLSERLENASYRYMVAEKKLDRTKSAVVARLEKQYTQSSTPVKAENDNVSEANGVSDMASDGGLDEGVKKEALAVSEKRKQQLEQLEEENRRLTEEVTALTTRLAGLTDDDYAKTELFKAMKSQHEDVIKRINHLEATNVQLREEAQKLQAERSQYRMQLEEEARLEIGELESQRIRQEGDLARVRNLRDELQSELAIKKATQEQYKVSAEQMQELTTAREHRIAALETEIERLRVQPHERTATLEDQEKWESMSAEQLRTEIGNIEKAYALLRNELPSMEAAWKKAQALAAKKVAEIANWEEQSARLNAEKAKADQKYFGAMKAKEAREAENRAMRAQNAKSSEIVTQLKEAESSSRALAVNLEKQLSEAREALNNLSNQQRSLQQKFTEQIIMAEGLTGQIAELKKAVTAKDTAYLAASQSQRRVEVENEELNTRLLEIKKSLESWKDKAKGNENDNEKALRFIAYCTVCNQRLKSTAIKTCGHVFCRDCVEEQMKHRSRKCPTCMKSFGTSDFMTVFLGGEDY